MLIASDLSYAYPRSKTLSFPNIRCDNGEHWLILGRSGVGKTTFLHLLAGLLTPKTGQISVGSTSITELSASNLDRFRGKNIGIIFQKPHFIAAISVVENLLLAQKLAGAKVNRASAGALLDRLNVGHQQNSKPSRLSAGEQQRVAIARALVNHPSIIFADEPTSALDDGNCEAVIKLLEEQAAMAGATLLIVTHDNRLKTRFPNAIEL